jgi:hypothetical protein
VAFLTLVQPVQEPVSLPWMKNYLRLDATLTADDELISSLIRAAREWAENFCERAFVFQTKRLLMDFFPGYVDFKLAGQRVSSPFVSGSNAILVGIRYAIALPWPQVRSIVEFLYQDQNGASQSFTVLNSNSDPTDDDLDPNFYCIQDLDSQPARLMPLFGQMWPVARVVANAVQVDYVTGYWGSIPVSVVNGSAELTSSFIFLPRDVGAAIAIPGAAPGTAGSVLNTTIAAVNSEGAATLAANAGATIATTTDFGVLPHSIRSAITLLVSHWYENRDPDQQDIPFAVKALLYPYRDLRL